MRIDAYNQIAQVYKTTSAAKLQKTENARHGRDEVQISSFGRDYQIAKQAVTEAADIREDKVAELKAKVTLVIISWILQILRKNYWKSTTHH